MIPKVSWQYQKLHNIKSFLRNLLNYVIRKFITIYSNGKWINFIKKKRQWNQSLTDLLWEYLYIFGTQLYLLVSSNFHAK